MPVNVGLAVGAAPMLALAVDADGVHLGQQDIPISIARKLLGHELLVGKSIHSKKELEIASNEGCDYLGIGPVNPTEIKPNLQQVDLNLISKAIQETSLPCFAIGGVTISNIQNHFFRYNIRHYFYKNSE